METEETKSELMDAIKEMATAIEGVEIAVRSEGERVAKALEAIAAALAEANGKD